MHSNYDYSGNWAMEQKPVLGINHQTGNTDIDPYDESGDRYLNPRCRLDFFTKVDSLDYFARFKHDIGPAMAALVGELREDNDYDMDDKEHRKAYRFKVEGMIYAPGQEQGTSLGFLRAISSDGKDKDGAVIYPDNVFDVGVGKPGKFTMVAIDTPEGQSYEIGFECARKTPLADAAHEKVDGRAVSVRVKFLEEYELDDGVVAQPGEIHTLAVAMAEHVVDAEYAEYTDDDVEGD